MHSYLITGIRMGPLMTLLRKHGFNPTPRNLGRLLFIFQNAFWSTVLTWRENKINGERIRSFRVPEDPVIIIGHWRTGSTFLHQLLALDEQFITPRLYQTSFPDSFLVSERFFRPIMGAMVKNRPMDNVSFGFYAPNEDEFALLRLTRESPLMKIIFPEKSSYFMNEMDDFLPDPGTENTWKEIVKAYGAKVCMNSGRILLLKNPAHSLRIPILNEVFPRARYIHLHRHPYEVVASSRHLWKVMAYGNQLRGKTYDPQVKEIALGLAKFYRVIKRDLAMIPPERQCEIYYEDLERDITGTVRTIYDSFKLRFTEGLAAQLAAFPEKNKDFRKNSYTFDQEEKALVHRLMKEEFEKYQYKP